MANAERPTQGAQGAFCTCRGCVFAKPAVLGKVLKDATAFFSMSTPNLATVIPAMDLVDEQLRKYASDSSLSRSIRAGVAMAKRTLNHYYSLTDSSEVYRIAMGKFRSLIKHLS